MRHTHPCSALVLATYVVAGACSDDNPVDRPDLVDIFEDFSDETGDAAVDAVDGPIADLINDADTGGIAVTVEPPTRWQRGAVSIFYEIDTAGSMGMSVNIEYSTADPSSESFFPATNLDGFGDGHNPPGTGRHRFVWDSFSDLSTDAATVWIRVGVRVGGDSALSSPAGPFAVLNDPDRPRALLMTSSINDNDQVRRLVWTHDSGLSYDEAVETVGLSPDGVAFELGGRSAALVGSYSDKIVFLTIEADGRLGAAESLETPGLAFDEALFSADSSTLYAMVFNPTDYGGGIYQVALDPQSALPLEGATATLLYAVFVPTSFALVPDQRGIVLHGTSRDDPQGAIRFQWIDLEGNLLDDVFYAPEDSSAERVAVSPDGRWALASYSNLFTGVGGAQLIGLGTSNQISVAAEDSSVALDWVADVAFHDSSTSALVTQFDPDRVISLSIDAGGTLTEVDRLVLGAADRITRTQIGSDRNVFFVTTVHPTLSELGSGLGLFRLEANGSATALDPFYLGAGFDKIPSDVAIQP